MKVLDLYVSSWPEDIRRRELNLWLKNSPDDSAFSIGLKQLLTIFSEDTLYKIRSLDQEVVFQQEGIYRRVLQGSTVIAKDSVEEVCPFRVFKTLVREGLHPYLQLKSNEFLVKQNSDLQDYNDLVQIGLSLNPKSVAIVDKVHDPVKNQFTPPLQVIYYGAPGTGKSYKIKNIDKGQGTKPVRTTFHPDSDYATFVGAYKPTMEVVPRYESSGTQVDEKRIVYNFMPQAFLKAYVQAWANYPEPQYLVIEEINRGNCAQIFGDLFQLLDRSATGFSEYPIAADSDISKSL